VHVVGELDYRALFDHVAAVVHHGGAGTTALGLLHGRPTLALPHRADQFFWGHRLRALQLGPPPVNLSRVTRARLAEQLSDLVSNRVYARRANALASRLRDENSDAVTVAAFERFAGAMPAPRALASARSTR
jgi:UDP:flavonoid glycosyltransferase YjiC (YdhE family)